MVSNNLNIPSIQSKTNLSFQANPQMGAGQVGDPNYLTNRVVSEEPEKTNYPLKAACIAGTWYVANQAMDRFNASLDKKDYYETAYGKIDKFSAKVKDTIFGEAKDRNFLGKGFDKFTNWWKGFRGNTLEQIPLTKTLLNDTAVPEWKIVEFNMHGVGGFSMADCEQIYEQFFKHTSVKLDDAGNIKSFNVKKLEQYLPWDDKFSKLTAEQLMDKELECLNKMKAPGTSDLKFPPNATAADKMKTIREAKLNVFGLPANTDEKQLSEALKNIKDEMYKDPKAFAKKHPNLLDMKFSVWRHDGGIKAAIGHLGGRVVTLREMFNKAIMLKEGSFLSKMLGYAQEGLTSRFGGGKLAALFQAFFLGDAVYHTVIAPKGEKTKTFIERAFDASFFIISIPLSVMATYKLGGLRWTGVDKAGYLKDLAAHNADRKAGKFATDKAAREAYNAIVQKYKPEGFLNRLCWRIGRAFDAGNACAKARQVNGGKGVGDFFRRVFSRHTAKNIAGVPMRFGLAMMLISPFISDKAMAVVHKIFGKPTHSVSDEGKESNEVKLSPAQQQMMQQQMAAQAMAQQQYAQQYAQQQAQQYEQPVQQYEPQTYEQQAQYNQSVQFEQAPQYYEPQQSFQGHGQNPFGNNNFKAQSFGNATNFGAMTQNNPSVQHNTNVQSVQNSQQQVQQNNETNTQNTTVSNTNKAMEPKRTYVPSPFGMVKPSAPDMTGLDKAMADADNAEKLAQSVLNL